MKFETKYNLGDKVWFIKRDVIQCKCGGCGTNTYRTKKIYVMQGTIDYISCWAEPCCDGWTNRVSYGCENTEFNEYFDRDCYATKKEALAELKKVRIKDAKDKLKRKKACEKTRKLG